MLTYALLCSVYAVHILSGNGNIEYEGMDSYSIQILIKIKMIYPHYYNTE